MFITIRTRPATTILLFSFFVAVSSLNGDICYSDGVAGVCKPVLDCIPIQDLAKKNAAENLRKLACGFQSHVPLICCIATEGNSQIVFNNKEEDAQKTTPATSTRPAPAPSRTTAAPVSEMVHNFINSVKHNETTKIVATTTTKYTTTEADSTDTIFEVYSGLSEPTPSPLTLLPNRTTCGVTPNLDTRILGGTIAKIDEFPWIVRINLKSNQGRNFYGCGGTLINEQYVLTAAHCIKNPRGLVATEVRLGEWDSETEKDCFEGFCNNPPVNVKIVEAIVHPDYKDSKSGADIALLRLEHPVNYTDFIIPICMPTESYVAGMDYLTDSTYVIAGWGKTETAADSKVLRILGIKAVEMNICEASYPDFTEKQKKHVICAGGRRGEDACAGDSGGPLIKQFRHKNKINNFLLGIISFGPSPCGMEGAPSVYTRIVPYLPWILNNIKP